MEDIIKIKELNVKSIIGTEKWGKVKFQPVIVDVTIYTDILTCGKTDLLSDTIDYSEIAKNVIKFSENGSFTCLQEYCVELIKNSINKFPIKKLNVKAALPAAYLSAQSIDCSVTRTKDNLNVLVVSEEDLHTINNLRVYTIIGANDCEREEKQELNITLTYPPNNTNENNYNQLVNDKLLAKAVEQLVEKTRFITIEALASSIANLCLASFNIQKINVRVEKPKAVLFASASVVEIRRSYADLPNLNKVYPTSYKLKGVENTKSHTAYIALGGNLGRIVENINKALNMLSEKCQIIKTSFLYETKPMYVVDQPNFINGACMVYTDLEPHDLLKFLKKIEEEVGRTPTIRNGPRVVDLDILFYDDIILNTEDLIIPHPRIQERRFVLEPLNDIAKDYIHPVRLQPVYYLLNVLKHSPSEAKNSVKRVMPIRNNLWCWDEKTYLMGILNSTPDSFSDGGKFNSLEKGLEHAKEMYDNGVDIIDIGGMSTRPFSDEVSEEEELNRVIPLVKAIREQEWGKEIPISIDTYRAEVALQSVQAGADLINDVTGGEGDPKMFEIMAKTDVPVCLMHMRGTPKTMQTLCKYENDDVVTEIEHVLAERLVKAQLAGVKQWNIIIDPGIGFSKDLDQNYEIINKLKQLVHPTNSLLANFPTLVGPSRKRFIGTTLNENDPSKRVYGTAAVCTALIAENVSVLRVHDFKEIKDIIKISDRMYRNNN